jgi:hypothetical protein
MNTPHKTSSANPFLWFNVIFAIGIVAWCAVQYATYRNLQIQTAREIEAAEGRISSLIQDEIPNLNAEIDRHLARYVLREKLLKNRSDLVTTPPERIEVIRTGNTSNNPSSLRP